MIPVRPGVRHFELELEIHHLRSLVFIEEISLKNKFSLIYHLPGSTLLLVRYLTHWGRVTHICVSKLTIIGSDNGLAPDRRQAIIWTNVGILLIGPLGTNFSEISIEILTFSFKKMRSKVSSAKRRPFCLGLNVLTCRYLTPLNQGALECEMAGELSKWVSFGETKFVVDNSKAMFINFTYSLGEYSLNVICGVSPMVNH